MRILLRNDGPVAENVKKGLLAGAFQAKQLGVGKVTLIVGKKGTFASSYGPALGEAWAKKLAKGQVVTCDGIKVRLESLGTLNFNAGRILVALHISEEDMAAVDDLTGKTAIIYVPNTAAEGEAWRKKWNATVLGEKPTPNEPDLPQEVVQRLQALTGQRNLANGFTDPRELGPTKQMFKELTAAGQPIRPAEMEIWAVRNGWSAKQAQQLRKLAAKYVPLNARLGGTPLGRNG